MKSSPAVVQLDSIPCGVDFSRQSAMALRYAAALARATGAQLAAVYAVDPLLNAAAATAYDEDALARSARRRLRQFVRTTFRARQTAPMRIIVATRPPATTVLSVARRTLGRHRGRLAQAHRPEEGVLRVDDRGDPQAESGAGAGARDCGGHG